MRAVPLPVEMWPCWDPRARAICFSGLLQAAETLSLLVLREGFKSTGRSCTFNTGKIIFKDNHMI